MAMTPEERSQFQALLQQVDDMAQMVQRHNIELESQVVKLPIREVFLPPHFHRTDRISVKDLRDGFQILTSTPTEAAEEGTLMLYTIGSTATPRVAFRINRAWKTASLS